MFGSDRTKNNKRSKHNLKLIFAAAMDRSIDEAVASKLHDSEERIVEKVVDILSKRNRVEPADCDEKTAGEHPFFESGP
jgi:hypothetical protein